jgi:phospholipid transport system substrate-binding protein
MRDEAIKGLEVSIGYCFSITGVSPMSASRAPFFAIGRRLPMLFALVAIALGSLHFAAATPTSAQASDPAVRYMDGVAKELIAASRTRSAATLQSVILRHADLGYMGAQGLGDYGSQLSAADKPAYFTGMTRWMSRYAISEAGKYQVSHVTFQPSARPAKYGLTVDSTVHMRDGSSYDVSWLLNRSGGGYKVRDAQVMSFWMTPQLNRLFSSYISENGGHVKALVIALNR